MFPMFPSSDLRFWQFPVSVHTSDPAATVRLPLDEALVSIVLPVYNEAEALQRLADGIEHALAKSACRFEVLFINDGSTDGSGALLDEIAAQAPCFRVLHFSRNFGHQAALQAGLIHAAGDCLVIMDSDLQDDPEAIPRFLIAWQNGYDVVYAVRTSRKEGPLKRLLFYAFYRVLNAISQTPIPEDAGNFGLIDRRVAEHVAALIDRDRYFPGLRRWVGFRQTGIEVERRARYDDTPRVSLRGLFRLAKTAIFSFSSFPLSMFYAIAAVSLAVFGGLSCFALYHKLFTGLAIPGWTSTTLTASLFGALNAFGIGILGEYVIRIYDQVRQRPVFLIDRAVNFENHDSQNSSLRPGSCQPTTPRRVSHSERPVLERAPLDTDVEARPLR